MKIRKVNDCSSQLEKMAEMEDCSHRSNARSIYLKEGDETDDPIEFLQRMIPKWILSISHKVVIERAHCIQSGPGTSNASDRPRTLIFKILRYNHSQAILQGDRAAELIHHAVRVLRFFPDHSTHIFQCRKVFNEVLNKLSLRGIQSFLVYPATLQATHRGERLSFTTAQDTEELVASLGEDNHEHHSELVSSLCLCYVKA